MFLNFKKHLQKGMPKTSLEKLDIRNWLKVENGEIHANCCNDFVGTSQKCVTGDILEGNYTGVDAYCVRIGDRELDSALRMAGELEDAELEIVGLLQTELPYNPVSRILQVLYKTSRTDTQSQGLEDEDMRNWLEAWRDDIKERLRVPVVRMLTEGDTGRDCASANAAVELQPGGAWWLKDKEFKTERKPIEQNVSLMREYLMAKALGDETLLKKTTGWVLGPMLTYIIHDSNQVEQARTELLAYWTWQSEQVNEKMALMFSGQSSSYAELLADSQPDTCLISKGTPFAGGNLALVPAHLLGASEFTGSSNIEVLDILQKDLLDPEVRQKLSRQLETAEAVLFSNYEPISRPGKRMSLLEAWEASGDIYTQTEDSTTLSTRGPVKLPGKLPKKPQGPQRT